MVRRQRGRTTILQDMIKRDALSRSGGCCEICGNALGNKHYFVYKTYKGVDVSSNVIVICSKCYARKRSAEGKIH